jgi:hypothetical protein
MLSHTTQKEAPYRRYVRILSRLRKGAAIPVLPRDEVRMAGILLERVDKGQPVSEGWVFRAVEPEWCDVDFSRKDFFQTCALLRDLSLIETRRTRTAMCCSAARIPVTAAYSHNTQPRFPTIGAPLEPATSTSTHRQVPSLLCKPGQPEQRGPLDLLDPRGRRGQPGAPGPRDPQGRREPLGLTA